MNTIPKPHLEFVNRIIYDCLQHQVNAVVILRADADFSIAHTRMHAHIVWDGINLFTAFSHVAPP